MKKTKNLVKGSLIAIILLVATICGLFVYSEKINKIEVIENAKNTIGKLVADLTTGTDSADMTVDITNIVNDAYPEHEHVWYDEYDETQHWKKCSVCKEVKEVVEHTLTTAWALGYESCETRNSYTTTCECGYGTSGRKPCVWNGKWATSTGPNQHVRVCANCGGKIGNWAYIDNVNGGILYPDCGEAIFKTGILDRRSMCKLSDGSPRPCDSNEECAECGGPVNKSNLHCYNAGADDNLIKCIKCGKVRRNM